MMLPSRLLAFLVIALASLQVAWSADDPYVPPDLEPWVPWVLDGKDYLECPFFGARQPDDESDHLCAWPGRLELVVDQGGVTFKQRWSVYASSDIALPGNSALWPKNVRSDSRPLPVTVTNGAPSVRLEPGDHLLSGRIVWQRRPAALPLPQTAGLVSLNVDGRAIRTPQRNGNQVWLGDRPVATKQAATVTAVVYRKLGDGVPMTVLTHLQLQVSGPEREELMGRILLTGFKPMSLNSPLPARIESDGSLLLQLRPGNWELSLVARADGLVDSIGFETGPGIWPDEEVWSYASNDRLRVTLASGGTPVDPARAGVPPRWQLLPAFRLLEGETLQIEERSRGQGAGIDNRMQLSRNLWMDFAGGGFTAVDTIQGQMNRDWRLDMAAPWRLAGATVGGQPALVTRGTDGATGIELRDQWLDVTAVGRRDSGGEIPVTGWLADFDSVHTTLNLPPGQRLIAAPGSDSSPTAWTSQWQLMDYFLLLLIAGAIGRLVDWRFGVLSGVMLVIIWQEPGAPIVAWLAVAIGIALAQHAPEGRLRRWSVWYRSLSLAGLVLIALPFVGQQLTQALFPQLDSGPAARGQVVWPPQASADFAMQDSGIEMMEMAPESPNKTLQLKRRRSENAAIAMDKVTVTGSSISEADIEAARRYAPGTLVQTGPGIPAWRYVSYSLSWSGPVSRNDTMRLIILGENSYRLLRVVGVLLIALLAWRLASGSLGWPRATGPGRGAPAVAAMLAAIALLPIQPSDAAEFPDPLILEELRQRLLQPPDCAPSCSSISRAGVLVADDRMTIELAINARQDVAVAVPGRLDGWMPDTVSLDGKRIDTLSRHGDKLFARIPAGLHLLRIAGALPQTDELRLPFPHNPHYISVAADGWSVVGVRDGKLPGGTLQLIRTKQTSESSSGALKPGLFPPFVRVTRSLTLGLNWVVTTTVQRLAPARAGFSVTIPLLTGEAVLTGNMDVQDDNTVVVRFPANQNIITWSSSLETSEKYRIDTTAGVDRQEVWHITASPMWRVDFTGTPAVAVNPNSNASASTTEFQPRAGESLEITANKPEGIDGATLVFDDAHLHTSVGRRATEATLTATYRSTRGGQHTITIPPQASVLEVNIDGRTVPITPDEGRLQIPLSPGAHRASIRWSTDDGISTNVASGATNLGAAAANIRQTLAIGADRWVLATSGPRVGPAVLYWSELLVFILLAFGLARIGYTPLRFHHWLLLGLGFSTFSWGVLLLVTVWLFVTSAREKVPMPEKNDRYNLVQIAYAIFTVIVLGNLLQAVPRAMLGSPDMHVTGNGSTPSQLTWFSDRVDGLLPDVGVISVPMWVYKAAILAWALWLAFALLKWLPWAWRAWNSGGLWRGKLKMRTGWKKKEQPKIEPDTGEA